MDVERRLRAALEAFAVDLDGLVRLATVEAVEAAFGGRGDGGLTGLARVGLAPPSPGAKRTPAELEALSERLLATIRAQPGLRIEQLADVMAVPSRSLTLPMRKLLTARKVRKKGAKRATTYFVRQG